MAYHVTVSKVAFYSPFTWCFKAR